MTTARLSQDGCACIRQLQVLRAILLVLWMAMVPGLQGCAALTVLAIVEVLESAQTLALAPEQTSVRSNQVRPVVSVAANKATREPRYRTRLDKNTIEAGTSVRLYSTTSLESLSVQGMVLGVEEILVVFDPKGREIRRGSKKATAGSGDGQFSNNFELMLPREAPAGSYRLVTEVYLGTQMVAREELKLTLTVPGSQRQSAQTR